MPISCRLSSLNKIKTFHMPAYSIASNWFVENIENSGKQCQYFFNIRGINLNYYEFYTTMKHLSFNTIL